MLFAAVAHCFVFPPEEWADGYREREERRRKRLSEFETHFGDSVALGDFIKDVKSVMASKRKRRLRKRKSGQPKPIEEEGECHDENDVIGASLSTDSRGSDDGQRNRIDSTESYDDEFDPQFSIDDEDDDDELEMAPTSVNAATESLRITNSTHSSRSSLGSCSERDADGSWARIEQYINEHEADSNGQPIDKDLTTKEIV
jgi:hypothetical protein